MEHLIDLVPAAEEYLPVGRMDVVMVEAGGVVFCMMDAQVEEDHHVGLQTVLTEHVPMEVEMPVSVMVYAVVALAQPEG
ncbi:MAG: hypothetical protein Q7T54_01200 [Candidatus Levybacteria bacterium]|nr:hypothetical protein [Candidatus Levybacteria bacterium]